jgi:hypothetical protein
MTTTSPDDLFNYMTDDDQINTLALKFSFIATPIS